MYVQEYKYKEHVKKLEDKWLGMKEELEKLSKGTFTSNCSTDSEKLREHQLPLARVKKIMKSDEDVKVAYIAYLQMISAEAPALFAKACEMFITELTHRAWFHTEENKRRTLQKSDISQALGKTDIFDFLIDIVPREEAQQRPVSLSFVITVRTSSPVLPRHSTLVKCLFNPHDSSNLYYFVVYLSS